MWRLGGSTLVKGRSSTGSDLFTWPIVGLPIAKVELRPAEPGSAERMVSVYGPRPGSSPVYEALVFDWFAALRVVLLAGDRARWCHGIRR